MNSQGHQQFAPYPSLRNRVVLITRGASGIGATVSHVPNFLVCDLTDIEALRSHIKEIQDEVGAATVLVNNAANESRHSYTNLTPEGWTARWPSISVLRMPTF